VKCGGLVEVVYSVELSTDEYKPTYEARCLICGWRGDERSTKNKSDIDQGIALKGMTSYRGRDKQPRKYMRKDRVPISVK